MTIGMEDWFMNFTQMVSTAVTPQSLANVPRPYTEFSIFGTFKGGEIASFIGGCIIHPVYRCYLRRRLTPESTTANSYKIIRNSCRRLQGRFLIGGLVAGPVIAMLYARRCNENELKEICYRIRCHEKNMVTDRIAFCLGFLGWYWKRFQGAVDGINIALAYSLFYFLVLRRHTLPVLIDNVRPEDRLLKAVDSEREKSVLHFFLNRRKKNNVNSESEKADITTNNGSKSY